MKVKLKLDANSIQQALVDHAEKALFALVVLGFLFFVYRAIGRQPVVKFDADELSQRARNAEDRLAATDPEASLPPDFKRPRDYKKVAEEIGTSIRYKRLLETENPLDPSIFPPQGRGPNRRSMP